MPVFPSLTPATRRYSMGIFPVTEERGFGGGSIRFRHSNTSYGHTLELGFTALTQAQAKELRDHYRIQQGGLRSFPLSSQAWAGHTSFTDLVPLTTEWRYASAPIEDHRTGGYADVSISLVSVPKIAIAAPSGLTATVTASLISGTATGS